MLDTMKEFVEEMRTAIPVGEMRLPDGGKPAVYKKVLNHLLYYYHLH